MKNKQIFILLSFLLSTAMFGLMNFGNAFWSKMGLFLVFVNFLFLVAIIRYYENQQKE